MSIMSDKTFLLVGTETIFTALPNLFLSDKTFLLVGTETMSSANSRDRSQSDKTFLLVGTETK